MARLRRAYDHVKDAPCRPNQSMAFTLSIRNPGHRTITRKATRDGIVSHTTALPYIVDAIAQWECLRVLNAPLDQADIENIEMRFNGELPREYRTFLTDVGNGGAGPHGGVWNLERSYSDREKSWQPSFLATPFPHTESVDEDQLPDDYDEDEHITGTMIIADMGCGVFARLVVSGEAKGEVWTDSLGVDGALSRDPSFRDWYLEWISTAGRSE